MAASTLAAGCTHPAQKANGTGGSSGLGTGGTLAVANGGTGAAAAAGAGGGVAAPGPDGGASVGEVGGPAGPDGGAPASAPPAATTFEMIDPLDDGDPQILNVSGRRGPWHAFNDTNGGNQQPAPGATFVPTAGGANNTPFAAHTSGSGYQFGGIGFDLANPTAMPESPQSQPYDASAYDGIAFWAKGNGNLRVEIPQRAFVPTERGGSCSSNCWNVYGTRSLQGRLTGTWQQFVIPFSSLQRDDGSMSPPFNRAELMGISFKHEGSTFDFWIDEVEFTRGAGTGTGTGTGGPAGGASGTGAASGNTGSGGAAGNVAPPTPITGGGMNGWASRYWDCCKPACGWRDNVGGGNAVTSCDQQNHSLGGNFDARNACEGGGTAYMCWSGAPWSVGPQLSYGFAAASGGNYHCGRCFQLQFSGSSHNGSGAGAGALSGKTMIVQVINNGGVADDQFDLLIPGGGVGALNACATQWGTADLGSQYGGFLAGCNGDTNCVRQKCQTVFAGKPELQAGCDWFLGWFSAADNPNLTFKQIACPAAITARSGLQDPG